MTLLYTSDPERGRIWRAIFAAEAADVAFVDPSDPHDPAMIRYLAAWNPSPKLDSAGGTRSEHEIVST